MREIKIKMEDSEYHIYFIEGNVVRYLIYTTSLTESLHKIDDWLSFGVAP